MDLHPDFRLYAFGPPAEDIHLTAFELRYVEVPQGYRDIVEGMTSVTLLWNRRGELRLWGPEEVIAMDGAYGVSQAIPGAVPIGDNGGGELIVYGRGTNGLGLYLVEAGSLFLDEDAVWLAADLSALLERAEGAERIFKSDPIDAAELGPPRFEAKYR